MPDLANFHLVRPEWLRALIPARGLWVLMLVEQGRARGLRNVIAPHLLEHLIRRPGQRSWFRPAWVALPCFLIGILALAGPAWERQKTPFVQDEAPLVVALDLSPSMNAIDVPPTRLQRAQQKIRDILALRAGARTGLIAYAGSAHMVLPLTDDPKVMELYLLALSTDLMPDPGKDPAKALQMGEEMLAKETAAGTILFVTDGIAARYAPAFAAQKKESRHQVVVLAVGTAQGGPVRAGTVFLTDARGRRVTGALDRNGLETLESQAGTYVVGARVDRGDVEKLMRRVNAHLTSREAVDERVPWEDNGYYLIFSALPLAFEAPRGVMLYPGQPKVAETAERGELEATRAESVAYVPEQEGCCTIPEITILWWNPRTKTMNAATLPALALQVQAGPAYGTEHFASSQTDEGPTGKSRAAALRGRVRAGLQ